MCCCEMIEVGKKKKRWFEVYIEKHKKKRKRKQEQEEKNYKI